MGSMIMLHVHLLTIIFSTQIIFISCAEVPLTEYEKLRAENLMRNNQKLQRLGVTTLASILNHTSAKSKVDTHEKSGSLYEVQEGEGSEDEEVNQVLFFVACRYFFNLIFLYISAYKFANLVHIFSTSVQQTGETD
jgi:hypothetical protein